MKIAFVYVLVLWSVACADVAPDLEGADAGDVSAGDVGGEEAIAIPAGTFIMGSGPGELGGERDETAHEVTISRDLMVGLTEVTQSQWRAVMGNNPSAFGGCGECPVEQVNWWEALEYLNRLSARDGLERCQVLVGCTGAPGVDFVCEEALARGVECAGWRLPTEAEWEYVARAGSATDFYNGVITDANCADGALGRIAWYCGTSAQRTQPVAGKDPNGFGLFDVSGNVFEWVWDRYGPYDPDPQKDPTGPLGGPFRVARGGGWFSLAPICRAARRSAERPEVRSSDIGFRAVRTLF